jgi:DNA repair exonuclease SbcCD ATPase subunit
MRSATGLNRSLYGSTTMRGSGSIGIVGGAMYDGAMSDIDKNLIKKAKELGEGYRLYKNIKSNMRGGAVVHKEPKAPNIFIDEHPKYEKDKSASVADKKQMIAMKRKEAKAKAEVEAKAKAEKQKIIDKEDEEEERNFMTLLEKKEKSKMKENKLKKYIADRWTESDEDYLKRVEKEQAYKIQEKKDKKEKDSKGDKAPMKVLEKKAEKLENKIEELKEVIVELKEDKKEHMKEMADAPAKKIKCRICGVVYDNHHLMSAVHLEALAKRKAERLRLKEEDIKNNPAKYEKIASERKQKANAWIIHLKAYREANPDVSYKVAMQRAKETYNR